MALTLKKLTEQSEKVWPVARLFHHLHGQPSNTLDPFGKSLKEP